MSPVVSIWRTIGMSPGVLTDADIIMLGEKNILISSGFEASQVKQTCYELRVGRYAYFLSRPENERKVEINEQNPLIVRPQEVVTIITYEAVNMPDFILGRIISKGHLFSIGLSPVITYADPGFSGNMGITFINLSKKTIKFGYKDSICKIEFEKLGKSVSQPYHGQHNFASEIWPIDANKFLPRRKIEKKDITDDRLMKADAEYFGEPFDLISEKLRHIEDRIRTLRFRWASVATVIGGILLFVLLERSLDLWKILPESMQSGIVSGIITGLFTPLAVFLEWWLFKRKPKRD